MRKNIYSVGQVNTYIQNMFAQDFMLHQISIKGEVSNCKYHSSGHIYFTLKDQTGTIAAVMFSRYRRGLAFQMKEGDKVVVTGSVEVYERDGKYQLYAREIELEGAGNLYLKFEALKRELEEMGMFDASYKKPLPKYALNIGVVTAQTGAVIHDIQNVAYRRNPYVQIYLYPAKVQGEGASETICEGIRTLDAMNPDVIIIGRGGGSIEDLWAFNEECVARAIFECNTPIISAVGHETDFTIADFVADMRAPTPSAAAELAVFDYAQWCERIRQYEDTLYRAMSEKIRAYRNRLASLNMELRNSAPERRLLDNKQYLDSLRLRLDNCMDRMMENYRHRFKLSATRLCGLSPLSKISGGFGYLEDSRGKTIRSIEDVERGEYIKIIVSDGSISAAVADKEKM